MEGQLNYDYSPFKLRWITVSCGCHIFHHLFIFHLKYLSFSRKNMIFVIYLNHLWCWNTLQKDISQKKMFHRYDILQLGNFMDREISQIGCFIDMTFYRQDISWIGKFLRRFMSHSIEMVFHGQGYFIDRTFHICDILQKGLII